MNNYHLEMVKRLESHTGNEIDCLHVMIDSNSNREMADTFIPVDDVLTAICGCIDIEKSKEKVLDIMAAHGLD